MTALDPGADAEAGKCGEVRRCGQRYAVGLCLGHNGLGQGVFGVLLSGRGEPQKNFGPPAWSFKRLDIGDGWFPLGDSSGLVEEHDLPLPRFLERLATAD